MIIRGKKITIDIPEFEELKKIVPLLEKSLAIAESTSSRLVSAWYNLKQCWELKGGNAWKSFQVVRYWQPKGGIPDAMVGGRKVWSKETVEEWLLVSDDLMPSYHEKYHTGCKRKER